MTSPRWRYRLLLTPLPLQEKQLTTIYEQDKTKRILEHEKQAEVPPAPETKTDSVRKLRGTLAALLLTEPGSATHGGLP